MANPLADFTLSEPVFIDTNVFVYHQAAHPDFGPDCRDFLDKVERGKAEGLTTSVVINEATYIMQIQRAANLLGSSSRSVIHARMALDQGFAAECWDAAEGFMNLVDALRNGGLTVIGVELSHYREACEVGRRFQLFTSDATHVVVCEALSIRHIASNDADFDRATFLTRWVPSRPATS